MRVWGIVVAGKKTDGVQANMLAFSPDAKRAYDDSMAFLEDLVDHAEAIGDSKVISKLGRLKTENFHAQIGGFAVLQVVVRLATTLTSSLLHALRGDPIKMTEGMEMIFQGACASWNCHSAVEGVSKGRQRHCNPQD